MIGKKTWAIAEGYIPPDDPNKPRELISHEAACILNVNAESADIEITIYFTNRDPAGPYYVTVPARRTLHLRFNDLNNPEVIPRGTDYSSVIQSNVPIIVQHTRLDGRRAENALLSTIAYGES